MKCAFCGGDAKEDLVTFSYEEGDRCLLVEHVPAQVCTRCGEKTFSPEVTDQLMRFAKNEFKPRRTIQVPVFDFAGRG
jgi:YgiT-type zinc finger domain-containing protein